MTTRTCIRQAAPDLAIYHGLSRTVTVTRQLVVVANGEARCSVQPNTRGHRGPALDADIPALSLKKHDKLEPWTGLQDIGDATSCSRRRHVLCGCSAETATRHRSPLLDAGLHTSLKSLTIDILHTWFLGIHLGLVENARGVTCFSSVWLEL